MHEATNNHTTLAYMATWGGTALPCKLRRTAGLTGGRCRQQTRETTPDVCAPQRRRSGMLTRDVEQTVCVCVCVVRLGLWWARVVWVRGVHARWGGCCGHHIRLNVNSCVLRPCGSRCAASQPRQGAGWSRNHRPSYHHPNYAQAFCTHPKALTRVTLAKPAAHPGPDVQQFRPASCSPSDWGAPGALTGVPHPHLPLTTTT